MVHMSLCNDNNVESSVYIRSVASLVVAAYFEHYLGECIVVQWMLYFVKFTNLLRLSLG